MCTKREPFCAVPAQPSIAIAGNWWDRFLSMNVKTPMALDTSAQAATVEKSTISSPNSVLVRLPLGQLGKVRSSGGTIALCSMQTWPRSATRWRDMERSCCKWLQKSFSSACMCRLNKIIDQNRYEHKLWKDSAVFGAKRCINDAGTCRQTLRWRLKSWLKGEQRAAFGI